MTGWMHIAGAVAAAALGAAAGWLSARRRGRAWIAVPLAGLATILALAAARRFPALVYAPPLSWLMEGRREFVLSGAAIAMTLSALALRTPRRGLRLAVGAFGVLAVAQFALLPFIRPMTTRSFLLSMDTQVSDDICLQNTAWTCGPAAAVTALRRFGIEAGEGEIALLAGTTRIAGAEVDLLRDALASRYGDAGLAFRTVYLASLAEVRPEETLITVIKYRLFVDHYVVLLGSDDRSVSLADPLVGRSTMPRAEFDSVWRHYGIAVSRRGRPEEPPQSSSKGGV